MQTTHPVRTRWFELLALVFFSLLMALKAQAGTPVLMLLDSRAKTGFGQTLDEKMRKVPGAEVTTYGLCRSTPAGWLHGATSDCGFLRKPAAGGVQDTTAGSVPPVTELLRQTKPRYTVIVTGEANLKDSPRKLQNDFRALARTVRGAGSKCLWVGPPLATASKDELQYYRSLRDVAEEVECAVADLPLLNEMEISVDLSDFVVELVKLGELDSAARDD